jgi:hypothetical protein
MSQVYQSKRERPSEVIVPLAAKIVGTYYGGPAGGAAAGALAEKAVAKNEQPQVPGSAMERRLGSGQPIQAQPQENNLAALQEARMALASQPPEVRQQYEAPIMAALMKQRREEQAQQSLMR